MTAPTTPAALAARTSLVFATSGALGAITAFTRGPRLARGTRRFFFLFLDLVFDLVLDEIFLDLLDHRLEARRIGRRRSGDLDRHARALFLAVLRDLDKHAVALLDLGQFAALAI